LSNGTPVLGNSLKNVHVFVFSDYLAANLSIFSMERYLAA
jgi:hypothetical protein